MVLQKEYPWPRLWGRLLCCTNSQVRIMSPSVLLDNFVEQKYYSDNYSLLCSKSVVSAGMFRIFGQEVAELPLVATDTDYQGQVILIYCWDDFFSLDGGAYSDLMNIVLVGLFPVLVFLH